MDRKQLRKKVAGLRKVGKTYSEIQQILGVKIPKSTLSYWCQSIPLPPEYGPKVNLLNLANCEKGRAIATIVNRYKREEFLKSLQDRNSNLLKNVDKGVLKMLLAMIYACEGSRWKVHRGLILGNTDPDLINFYIFLLKTCYPDIINHDCLRCRIGCRADQDVEELQKFWSNVTGVPPEHFYKTRPDSRTIGKKTKKPDYKGVCVVSCRGTEIQLELEIIAKMIFKNLITGP